MNRKTFSDHKQLQGPPTKSNTCRTIAVIGMHRSGTSMIMRLLHEHGLYIGPDDRIYKEICKDNLAGHYEHKGFIDVNDELLGHFEGAWNNPPTLPIGWEHHPDLTPIREKALKLIDTFEHRSHWGWKDPRTTLVAPFWQSLLPDLRFVICVRNPLEVACSLSIRDNIPLQTGTHLWDQYLRPAIIATGTSPRLFVFFDDMFTEPANQVERLISFCGLPRSDDFGIVPRIVRPELRHHHEPASSWIGADKLMENHKFFYLGMRGICIDQSSVEQISQGMNALFTLLDQASDKHKEMIDQLQGELQKQVYAARKHAEQVDQLKAIDQDNSRLQGEIEAREKRIKEVTKAIEKQQNELIGQQQIAQRRTQRVGVLENEKKDLQLTVRRKTQRVQELEIEKQDLQLDFLALSRKLQHQNMALQKETADLYRRLKCQREKIRREFVGRNRDLHEKLGLLDKEACDAKAEISRSMEQREKELNELERLRLQLKHALEDNQQLLHQLAETGHFTKIAGIVTTKRSPTEALPSPLGALAKGRDYVQKIAHGIGRLRKPIHRILHDRNGTPRLFAAKIFHKIKTLQSDSATERADEINQQIKTIPTSQTQVSVIMAVDNPQVCVADAIEGWLSQQGLRISELIIIDSGHNREVRQSVLRSRAEYLQLPPKEYSRSAAFNLGAQQAQAPYLLFTVPEAQPASETWLSEMLRVLETGRASVVSSLEAPCDDAGLFHKADAWHFGHFLENEEELSKALSSDHYSYLYHRRRAVLSGIACLIPRDLFMRYKFRSRIAEDMDLGLRLIKDGHVVVQSGRVETIYTHHRPPMAHLQRGYHHAFALSELFKDLVIPVSDPQFLIYQILLVFEVVRELVHNVGKLIAFPCDPSQITQVALAHLEKSFHSRYSGGRLDSSHIPRVASLQPFLRAIESQYQQKEKLIRGEQAELLDGFRSYVILITDYLQKHNDMVSAEVAEDFTTSLYEAFAFLCGSYLGLCFTHGKEDVKRDLAPIHSIITENSSRLSIQSSLGVENPGFSDHPVIVEVEKPAAALTVISGSDNLRARLIAFYLPQFHPIPENNTWWGEGFTEWTNVTAAKKLFHNHCQPHLPADLGFYDLRLAEPRLQQAQLAGQYGIEGFCYYHYWFAGDRLLEKPFAQVLASGEPDFPFCLAWANEPWSRRWLGEEKDILMPQTYSREDDIAHARWLVKVFADPRSIRVQGRPLFLIYRPTDLPEPFRTTDILRDTCLKEGLPDPFLLGINAHAPQLDFRALGFDGSLDFEPWLGALAHAMDDGLNGNRLRQNLRFGIASRRLKIYDYVEARRLMRAQKKQHPVYPSIFVSWDNSPRRAEKGIIIVNSSPAHFQSGLAEIVASVTHKPFDDRLVFLNAWNEWAEGNHLEPDQKHGHGYLQAVKEVNLMDHIKNERT